MDLPGFKCEGLMIDGSEGTRRWTRVGLPWLIGAGGLLIYCLTLDRWVSLRSLGIVARVSGWNWQPNLNQPLSFLVFYPFRFLPGSWIPLGLNLFAAACAVLVLALLARSVALWPHDRTHDQRWREPNKSALLSAPPAAWITPVLAAVACGLQLTFWEHATAGTGEMVQLVLFAAVIRGLLEFRVSQRPGWLSGCAFLSGLALANDWTLLVYFPGFLLSVVWLKGLAFLNLRFLLRTAAWGLAGLSLFLLLPALYSFSSADHVNFWVGLKASLRSQRDALVHLPQEPLVALLLTGLLPALVISIRWRTQWQHSGDDSRLGTFITRVVFHLAHGIFLAVSLWMALDPPFSPRNCGRGLPLLAQYYLSALVIGYCAGYFLLLGTVRVPKLRARLALGALGLLLATLPLAMVWRNLGQIRMSNGPALRQLARQLYDGLPPGHSVVLSDDPAQLLLLRAEVAGHSRGKSPLPLNTRWLASSQYLCSLASRFQARWPVPPPTNRVGVLEPAQLLELISRFAAREPMTYLHSSLSYLAGAFVDQPNGLLQGLAAVAGTNAPGQKLDDQVAAANERYWQDCWVRTLQVLAPLTEPHAQPLPRASSYLLGRLRLRPEQNLTVSFLAAVYGRGLNNWGVQMQRLGRWDAAESWFERALKLRPENLAARINLQFNQQRQRGDQRRLERPAVEARFLLLFQQYPNWAAVLDANGPVDEPTFLFETGRVLLAGGQARLAVGAFARCVELAPHWLEPVLWEAQARLVLQDFAGAWRLTGSIPVSRQTLDGAGLAQLLFCRATALRGLGRTNEAQACIEEFVGEHAKEVEVLSIASQLYLQGRQFQPALALLERLLRRAPNSPELLSNKGLAEVQLARYDMAIDTLSQALALAPSNQVVRLNRAIAHLRAGQLDAAQADYLALLERAPNSWPALSGLGEIAWRRNDTNAATRFYQQYLTAAPQNSAEYQRVAQRLQVLKTAQEAARQTPFLH